MPELPDDRLAPLVVVKHATRAGTVTIIATVPLVELFGYADRLRSRTHGRGTFIAQPAGYAPAPATVS